MHAARVYPLAVCLLVVVGMFLASPGAGQVEAALTADHRKEIADIRMELADVTALLAKDEFDKVREILNKSEERLRAIATAAMVPESDRALLPVFRLIATKRTILDKKSGTESGVSFTKEVAPILVAKCMNCHNADRTSGGLNLDSFAGMKAGGSSGVLLVIGNSAGSLIMNRLTATNNQRMPRGGTALPAAEIAKIASWINQGAKFDGEDESAKLNARPAQPDGEAVTIVKATGEETVSFTKDIAPFMGNLCVGCHSGNNPRGGLSLVNFESLMKGGDSGRVILAGNLEGSRLWRLVGGLEAPRMPQGQARITRKNYEDLRTWLTEGAKYDGDDPKTPLRSFIRTDEQIRAEQLAQMSAEDFNKYRLDRSAEQWKRANPKENARYLESKNFFVYGNASEDRLKQVSDWAEETAKLLQSTFNIKADPIWKGKLTVFVFRDRFSYEEFPREIEGVNVPRETTGHSRVVPSFEDAYICLEDIGDDATSESPGLSVALTDHLTGAYLKSSGQNLPDWLVRGTGLALAARTDKDNAYIQELPLRAQEAVKQLPSPADLFTNGNFSSADMGPVGYTLVEYMLTSGTAPNFARFVSQLQSGTNLAAALRSVYNADTNGLATAYLTNLATVKPRKRP